MRVGDHVRTERGLARIVYEWSQREWRRRDEPVFVVQLLDDPEQRFLAPASKLEPAQLALGENETP